MTPPYYAVIFQSKKKEYSKEYDAAAERIKELSAAMPGFLGISSARSEDGTASPFVIGIALRQFNVGERIQNM